MQASVVKYCAAIGRDPQLVQGAGGNVSWKQNGVMWVKASGFRLDEAANKDIFVPVALDPLRKALTSGAMDIAPQVMNGSSLRPSIETSLHALMPQQVVVHLHAVEILSHLVCGSFVEVAVNLRRDTGLSFGVVPYRKPGADLAAAVSACLSENSNLCVCFLKNHGVVIGAEDVDSIHAMLEKIIEYFRIIPKKWALVSHSLVPPGLPYLPLVSQTLHSLAFDPLLSTIKRNWVLYPDHAVFLGASPAIFDSWDEVMSLLKQSASIPELIFVDNAGVYALPSFSKAKLEQLQCYFDILIRQKDFSRLAPLSNNDIKALLDWDAEKYRQHLSDVD